MSSGENEASSVSVAWGKILIILITEVLGIKQLQALLTMLHESGRMRVSPLHVDIKLGPSIVKNEN